MNCFFRTRLLFIFSRFDKKKKKKNERANNDENDDDETSVFFIFFLFFLSFIIIFCDFSRWIIVIILLVAADAVMMTTTIMPLGEGCREYTKCVCVCWQRGRSVGGGDNRRWRVERGKRDTNGKGEEGGKVDIIITKEPPRGRRRHRESWRNQYTRSAAAAAHWVSAGRWKHELRRYAVASASKIIHYNGTCTRVFRLFFGRSGEGSKRSSAQNGPA